MEHNINVIRDFSNKYNKNRKCEIYKCKREPIDSTPLGVSNRTDAPATLPQHHNSSLPQQNKICDESHRAEGGLQGIIYHQTFNKMISFNDAVASLRKAGAKAEKDIIIKNVTVTDCDSWTRVALTLNREVAGPISDEEGNWTMGQTRVVFLSLYSVLGLLKNTDDTLAVASYIASHPTALQIILSGAKAEILQQEVKAHATYVNAFTGEETEHDSDHDSLFNHLVSIEFTDKARRGIEKIEDKLLGL